MALFQLDDIFGYQQANEIKRLWASSTAPSNPGDGEVWLDISLTPNQLKRYNNGTWEIIGYPTSTDILNLIKTMDGSGSGLDSDTLDGQEGSYYQNASNLNAGTIPLDRLPATLTGKDADTLDGQEGSYYTNASNINTGTLALDRIPSTLTGKSADTVDNIHASQFIRSDTNDNVTGNTEWQDNYNINLGNDADFSMWHDGTDTYLKSNNHGADVYLQAEDESGTNQTLLILKPDEKTVQTSGKFMSQKLLSTSIAKNEIFTTDIPEGTVGIFILKNISTGTAGAFFLGFEGAAGVKLFAGDNTATDGTAFYPESMIYRMCVYFDSGFLVIKNLTGANRTISAGFFSID